MPPCCRHLYDHLNGSAPVWWVDVDLHDSVHAPHAAAKLLHPLEDAAKAECRLVDTREVQLPLSLGFKAGLLLVLLHLHAPLRGVCAPLLLAPPPAATVGHAALVAGGPPLERRDNMAEGL